MKRRSLLIGTGALTAGVLLEGCSLMRGEPGLRVEFLRGSFPAQLLGEFQKLHSTRLKFTPQEQLANLFQLLQGWSPTAPKPASGFSIALPWSGSRQQGTPDDLVTLGDAWLTAAIQQQLIQPLATTDLAGLNQLPPQMQTLVRRDDQGNVAPTGKIWAAPYRLGTMAIAYRKDEMARLGWTPKDWSDLWRPELQRRISLPDRPHEVIGIALKRLGRSVNELDLNAVPELQATLDQLNQQVKFYSSDAFLQPLMLDDTWVAVGWSTDLQPLVQRDTRMAAVVPASGTMLTADLWVRPTTAPPADGALPELVQQWIRYGWEPNTAIRLSLLTSAVSPIVLSQNRETLPPALRNDELLLPSPQTLERSEFLATLPAATVEQYRQEWLRLRQGS